MAKRERIQNVEPDLSPVRLPELAVQKSGDKDIPLIVERKEKYIENRTKLLSDVAKEMLNIVAVYKGADSKCQVPEKVAQTEFNAYITAYIKVQKLLQIRYLIYDEGSFSLGKGITFDVLEDRVKKQFAEIGINSEKDVDKVAKELFSALGKAHDTLTQATENQIKTIDTNCMEYFKQENAPEELTDRKIAETMREAWKAQFGTTMTEMDNMNLDSLCFIPTSSSLDVTEEIDRSKPFTLGKGTLVQTLFKEHVLPKNIKFSGRKTLENTISDTKYDVETQVFVTQGLNGTKKYTEKPVRS